MVSRRKDEGRKGVGRKGKAALCTQVARGCLHYNPGRGKVQPNGMWKLPYTIQCRVPLLGPPPATARYICMYHLGEEEIQLQHGSMAAWQKHVCDQQASRARTRSKLHHTGLAGHVVGMECSLKSLLFWDKFKTDTSSVCTSDILRTPRAHP
jgi:hypothetical protein